MSVERMISDRQLAEALWSASNDGFARGMKAGVATAIIMARGGMLRCYPDPERDTDPQEAKILYDGPVPLWPLLRWAFQTWWRNRWSA